MDNKIHNFIKSTYGENNNFFPYGQRLTLFHYVEHMKYFITLNLEVDLEKQLQNNKLCSMDKT